jgi:hypothetical protein
VELKSKASGFYGNGETYLFKYICDNRFLRFNMFDHSMLTYRWSDKNTNFVTSDSDGIGFGCGDSSFGLYIGKNLINGWSDRTDTFDNECLSQTGMFKIRKIEVVECI